MEDLSILRLRPREDRRLRAGHHWVYSNEVDTRVSPLKNFEVGEQVLIEDSKGSALGLATINPHNLICARLFTRDVGQILDVKLIQHRLYQALALRQACFPDPCYRAFYGDSDGLSGLVIDRFNDVVVVQITTAGMEAVKPAIIEAIEAVYLPKTIVFANQNSMRELEGLNAEADEVIGSLGEWVALKENGVELFAPIGRGQKTGWFYDHRENRRYLNGLVKGKRVLDLFSYVGGWGIQAAVNGASSVTCVDASELALQGVFENSQLNNVSDKVDVVQGNVFEVLTGLKQDSEKFDVVIADPPAFIKKKKDHKNGLNAYRRINELGMRLVNSGGILVSASCSMHLTELELNDVLRASSRHIDRQLQILHVGSQGADHPVHPSIPETRYLKAIFSRVIRSF